MGLTARKRIVRWVLRRTLDLLIIWAALLMLFRWFEPRLLYAPPRTHDGGPMDRGLVVEDAWISVSDGVRIHAWWLPAPQSAAGKKTPTMLIFHGNAENISHGTDLYAVFHGLGWNQLAVDFRGYGRSEGAPSEKGLYRDGEAAYGYLRARGVEPGCLFVYGRSLGAAVAWHVAASGHPLAGVISEGAFAGTHEAARDILPWLPARLFVPNRFNTRRAVSALEGVPKLFVHARNDEIIPLRHARLLFEAAAPPKQLAVLQPGGHNDLLYRSGKEWTAAVEMFVERICPAADGMEAENADKNEGKNNND